VALPILLLSALMVTAIAVSTYGIDLSTLASTSEYTCMKNSGFSFSIPRAWCSFGGADVNGPQNVKNAQAAGIQYVDIYMFPCRSKDAATQVNELVDYMNSHLAMSDEELALATNSKGEVDLGAPGMRAGFYSMPEETVESEKELLVERLLSETQQQKVPEFRKDIVSTSYGMIWLDIETNPSTGCGWGTGYTSNCQYVTELVNQIKARGKVPGIYASSYMWSTIMGSVSACASLGTVPLWYPHYDGVASFSDFTKFGGWTKPAIKQYQGTTTECSVGIDKNWYP